MLWVKRRFLLYTVTIRKYLRISRSRCGGVGAYSREVPYGVVARSQMERLPEGLLPGHIIMLWRVHFGTFTTDSSFPRYFEYRYGVDGREVLSTLLDKGYI